MLKKYIALLMAAVILVSGFFVGGNLTASAAEVSSSDMGTAPTSDGESADISQNDIASDADIASDSDIPPEPEPEPEINIAELKPVAKAVSGGYDRIVISWDSVETAVSYEVWRSADKNGNYLYIATVEELSYTNTGRNFNKNYYYKVRGINAEGEYSAYSDIASAKALPSSAKNVTASRYSYNKIKIRWDKVPGASGYTIYRSTSENGKYTAIKRLTKGSITSYINSSLAHGKTYYYKVKPYRYSSGTRIYGEDPKAVSATPLLSAPANVTLTRSSYKIIVKWNSVSGAAGYKVYRATDPDGEYILLGSTSSAKRNFINSTVVPGVTYYYKIVATRSGREGMISAVKSQSAVMSKPSSVKAASAGCDSIKVSWGAVTGATGYVVYRSERADGSFDEIGRTTSAAYTDKGLTLGKAYYYKVAAYRTSKGLTGIGTVSAAVSAKPAILAPTISSAMKNSTTSIKVAWKAVSGADGYYIYRAASSGGTYSEIGKVGADTLSFIDEDRKSNTYYYYKVRAYKNTDGGEVVSALSAYKSGRITKKVAYLTFDDGPSCNTMKILDILDKYDVKATFFVVGKTGRDKEYKAIVDRGHTIALHTYSHNYSKVYASESAFFKEIDKISDKVYNVTGVRSKIIRFPGGSSNTVYKKYCSGLMKKLKKSVPAKGYYYHDWNVSSGDANGNNIAKTKIINNVKGGCKGKNTVNILMHDTGSGKNTTVQALPAIIEYLLAQGYDIQPITESSVCIQH